jgi:hypothetical protein
MIKFSGPISSAEIRIENIAAPSWSNALTVSASVTTGLAPLGVIFSINNLSDDVAITAEVKWFTTDQGNFNLIPAAVAVPRSKGRHEGPQAAVCFEEPGSYEVYAEVNGARTNTVTITAQDPDVEMTDVIAIDPDSIWLGAPSGAEQVTSIANAVSYADTNNLTDFQVLFPRGKSVALAGIQDVRGTRLGGASIKHRIYFGAYGSGSDPEIDHADTSYINFRDFTNSDNEFRFCGVKFCGNYNPNTGLGTKQSYIPQFSGTDDGHAVFHKCTISGHRGGVITNTGVGFVFSENVITDWEDYAIFCGSRSYLGCVGNSMIQALDATNGSEAKDLSRTGGFNFPDHSFRTANTLILAVNQNWFFFRNGWSSAGDEMADQGIRLRSSAATGCKYSINGNYVEGGFTVIDISRQNDTEDLTPYDYCSVQKNHIIGTAGTKQFIMVTAGNTSIRGNIFVMPNVPNKNTGNAFQLFIGQNKASGNTHINGNENKLIDFSYNTCIDLRSTENQSADSSIYDSDSFSAAGYTNAVVINNLHHAPNRTIPVTTYAPLKDTADTLDPLYDGSRETNSSSVPTLNSSFATPVGVGSTGLYRPDTGSSAIGGATGKLGPLSDFEGNDRGNSLSIGALEYK